MDEVEEFIQDVDSEGGSVFSDTERLPRERAVMGDRQGMRPAAAAAHPRPLRR